MERRRHTRRPIRLEVRYRSVEAVITEYTTCVSRGGCALVSTRSLELGTSFVFALFAHGEDTPLEIEGRVARVLPLEGTSPRFEIGIEYITDGPQRARLDSLLAKVMVDDSYETVRAHRRIPINLIARSRDATQRYLVRDLSLGGMRVETKSINSGIGVGTTVALTTHLSDMSQPISIAGELVWLHRGSRLVRTRIGVQFIAPSRRQLEVLEGLTRLLRPHSLELAFPDERTGRRLSQPMRVPRSNDEIRELIEELAIKFLMEQPYLALSVVDAWTRPAEGLDLACVGVVGDIDGEISLRVDLGVGAHIASQTLDEVVTTSNHAQIIDAIIEWTTALAGFVCDQLDEIGVELDVSAPIPGEPKLGPPTMIALQGPYGLVLLGVVTRELTLSEWPI